MSDLNFVTDGTIDRIACQRAHREAILRDCAKHDLKLSLDYAEAALDHLRDMQRARFSAVEELKDTRVTLEAFLVAVMAMQREEGVE
jgi:hypothetical protein